jgi:hypothetical protein
VVGDEPAPLIQVYLIEVRLDRLERRLEIVHA